MLPDRLSGLLTAYVDGELGEQQRQVVLRLLRRSPEARELLRNLQKDVDLLRGLPRHSLGQDFSQQVLQGIASRKEESAQRSAQTVRSYLPAWLGLASAAAVLLVVGFGSYVYFAAADRQKHAGRLAVRTTESDRSSPEHEFLVPEMPALAPAERSAPEILGHPAPATAVMPSSSLAVASPKDGRPQAVPSQTPLAGPLRHDPKPLKDPELRIGLVFEIRDLEQDKWKQQLHQALQQGTAHRIDLRCTNTLAGIERLRAAFASRGIQFVNDQDARAILDLGMGTDTTAFALYLQEVTAEDMITIFQQLSSEDRKGETKRRGGRFEGLIVKAMAREDQQKLSWLLGIDSAQWDAPRKTMQVPNLPHPKGEAGVDFRKPMEPGFKPGTTAATEEQVIKSLKGQGTPRPEPAKPATNTLQRQVLVVAYTPGRPRPMSPELKRFLDSRKERRAGTMQILLVLSSTRG